MERKTAKTMARGGIKRWQQKGWPVLFVGGLLGGQLLWAQEIPTVDSLVIAAGDRALERNGFYNPAQAVQFYLIYKGAVGADTVRGALKLQGQFPQSKRLDTLATWLFFGGPHLRRPSADGWSALPIDSLSLGAPVLNDGGIIQFSPQSGGALFQVYGDSLRADQAQPAPNMRVTTIEADGDDLWVAGVFPGTGGGEPRGFLALKDKDGGWSSPGNPLFARGDTIQLSETLVTAIAATSQDVWFGTVKSGLLRFNKETKNWFQYTAERDRLAGNGIPVVAAEDDNTVWVGVKDSVQVRGLERVRLLPGDVIAVAHFGGLPLSRVPFPSLDMRAVPDTLPDFVRVLLVDSLKVSAVVKGSTSDSVIFTSFPDSMRVPNPGNSKADLIRVKFPSRLKARIVGPDTSTYLGSTQTVQISAQTVRISEGNSLVAVNFPPGTIDFPTGDAIPDSVDVSLPEAVPFQVGTKNFKGIFLEPNGRLELPGKTIQFPQVVNIGTDSAEIFADQGRIKLHLKGLKDTTLEASSRIRIKNPILPQDDSTDFVVAPLPEDSVQATFNGNTVWVKLDNPQMRVDGKTQDWPSNLRYQRVTPENQDSLVVLFPAVLRIPNPGQVGEPDFRVTKFQPPEDSIVVAIAIDPDTKDKWIGTGGSGLARLRVSASDSASWNILPAEGSLRSAIIFSIQIEKRGAQKYLWAGTDAGLLRLEVNGEVNRVLSDSSLVDSLQTADSLLATADARGAWSPLFSSVAPTFSSATSSIRAQGNSLRARVQSSLDTIRDNLVVFSPDNSPIPDKMVRDLVLAGVDSADKWLATARGLVLLRDDKTGSVHHWQLFSAQQYGGRRDSLTAVEARGETVWLGRLPTWYSKISWSSAPTSMPKTLEKIRTTAYFSDSGGSGQPLSGTFNFDAEPPTIPFLGPDISSTRAGSVRSDTLIYPGQSEFFATVEDGEFSQEGIDSVRVYLDPTNRDSPKDTSLVSSSLFHGNGGTSQRVYSVIEDSLIKTVWTSSDTQFVMVKADGSSEILGKGTREGNQIKVGNLSYPIFGDTLLPGKGRAFSVVTDTLYVRRLRRHNFSFTAPATLTPGRHTLTLVAVDRAGNTTPKSIAFWVQDTTAEVPLVFLNYPNPFGKDGEPTFFYYVLNNSEKVSLRIFDLSGVLVNILIRDEGRERGTHQEIWDGRDFFGQPLANGVYLCELEVGRDKQYTKAAIFR